MVKNELLPYYYCVLLSEETKIKINKKELAWRANVWPPVKVDRDTAGEL
jgi:hypothetical protein